MPCTEPEVSGLRLVRLSCCGLGETRGVFVSVCLFWFCFFPPSHSCHLFHKHPLETWLLTEDLKNHPGSGIDGNDEDICN